MKVNKIIILIFLATFFSCSKQLTNIEQGLYTNGNYGGYLTEINLLDNNTFCKYYEMECIAMPQMNLGIYKETTDSIVFIKNINKFLDNNIKIEYDNNKDFLEVQPYVLIDFLSRDEKWTHQTELMILSTSQGDTLELAREQFFNPISKTIKISKDNLSQNKKIMILDVKLNHIFEIQYNQNISKILTPTGFVNMNCYKRNRDMETYRIDKYKNRIRFKYSDKHKVKYNLVKDYR